MTGERAWRGREYSPCDTVAVVTEQDAVKLAEHWGTSTYPSQRPQDFIFLTCMDDAANEHGLHVHAIRRPGTEVLLVTWNGEEYEIGAHPPCPEEYRPRPDGEALPCLLIEGHDTEHLM